jgi:DNA-binding NarL/FixJ family response regulator
MAKTILVVDDNPAIRKRLCELVLAEQSFEVCAEAANGLEAIDLAKSLRPALIILDLSMPLMNGATAARELKRLMPDVPIILFTQYADLGTSLLTADLPVDRIVSKTETEGLMGHVRALVAS